MSTLPPSELDRLQHIALEVFESVEAESFTVTAALSQNPHFMRTRTPARALERSTVMPAAARGAGQVGMQVEPAPGGGLDLVSWDGRTQRRYRVMSARRRSDGNYRLICGAGSSLLRAGNDHLLWPEERWVMAYTITDDHVVSDFIATQIIDYVATDAGPVRLIHGMVHELTPPTPPDRFDGDDESLDDDIIDSDQGDVAEG